MKISDLNNLINIRNYIANSINNFSLKKDKVNELTKILYYLDNYLTNEILNNSFKNEISFNEENVNNIIKEVINMKSGNNK